MIWAASDPVRLGAERRAALEAPHNKVMVSAVTAWEVAIKRALGRLQFPIDRFEDMRT